MIMIISSRANGGATAAAKVLNPDLQPPQISTGFSFTHTFESRYLSDGKVQCHCFAQEHTEEHKAEWLLEIKAELQEDMLSGLVAFVYVFEWKAGIDTELFESYKALEDLGWRGTFISVPIDGLDECPEEVYAQIVGAEIGIVDWGELKESCLVAVADFDDEFVEASNTSTNSSSGRPDGRPSSMSAGLATESTATGMWNLPGSFGVDSEMLAQVYEQLLAARSSDMTEKEKLDLADQLSHKLIP